MSEGVPQIVTGSSRGIGRATALALGLGSVTAITWAFSVMVQDNVVTDLDPVLANAVQMSSMAIILVTMVAVVRDPEVRSTSRADISGILLSGVLTGVSALCFMSALKWSSPATVVVLNSTSPLFATPLAFLMLHERITRKVLLGTAASVAGVMLTLT